MSRRAPLVWLSVAAMATAASSCAGVSQAGPSDGPVARTVAVALVTREELRRTVEIAAEFRPAQEINLHAKVPGFLKAIHVDVGDRVKRGQLIAELEAPEMNQDLAQAEATLQRARVDVERGRAELRRNQALATNRRVAFERLSSVLKGRPNLVAQQELDDASARHEDASAQVGIATAALASAEEQVRAATAAKDRLATLLTYLRITAPFDGVITRRFADHGAMIQAGTASHVQAMPIVELSDVDHLRLVLPVPESVVSRIKNDAPVEVRVDSLQRVFQGRVARFTGKLDASTRTMETEVDLPNRDGLIKAGMFGAATLVLDRRERALTIPVEALSGRSLPVKVLAVTRDKKLVERTIETGLETPDHLEVLSGLHDGDVVVVGSRSNLRPGQSVTPKVIETAAAEGRH